jgi:hypothetical protein
VYFTTLDGYGDTVTVSGTVSADTNTSAITGSSLTFSLVDQQIRYTPFPSETFTLPDLPTYYGNVTISATTTQLSISPTDPPPAPGNQAAVYWSIPSPSTGFYLFDYSSYQIPPVTSTLISFYNPTGINGESLFYNYSTTSDSITLAAAAAPSQVPEPGTMAMLMTALAGTGGYSLLRERFRKHTA